MTILTSREIRNRHDTRFIPDLLQSLFIAELLHPSEEIYLISPWITDVKILNNTAGEFTTLVPSWEWREIRLTELLLALVTRGTNLYIATRDEPINRAFLTLMREQPNPVKAYIHLRCSDTLHEKGLLTSHFFLSGTFNYTFSGITLNEEFGRLETDSSRVAENQIILASRWKEPATI